MRFPSPRALVAGVAAIAVGGMMTGSYWGGGGGGGGWTECYDHVSTPIAYDHQSVALKNSELYHWWHFWDAYQTIRYCSPTSNQLYLLSASMEFRLTDANPSNYPGVTTESLTLDCHNSYTSESPDDGSPNWRTLSPLNSSWGDPFPAEEVGSGGDWSTSTIYWNRRYAFDGIWSVHNYLGPYWGWGIDAGTGGFTCIAPDTTIPFVPDLQNIVPENCWFGSIFSKFDAFVWTDEKLLPSLPPFPCAIIPLEPPIWP